MTDEQRMIRDILTDLVKFAIKTYGLVYIADEPVDTAIANAAKQIEAELDKKTDEAHDYGYTQGKKAEQARVEKVRKLLKEKSDRAYCDYIDQLRKPECLGWEAKIEADIFGKAELNAHNKASELLGRSRAFADVTTALAEREVEDG